MAKCKECKISWWGNDLNTDGICGICIRRSVPERSQLITFGIFHSGRCSLHIDGTSLLLTELKIEKTGKITNFPLAGIQEFTIKPPVWRSHGRITFNTANAPFALFETPTVDISLAPDELPYAQNIQKYITDFQASASAPAAPQVSVADELVKLKALVDQGILTQEEFEHKKKVLLGM